MQNYYPLKLFKDPLREDLILPGDDECVVVKKVNGLGYKTYAFYNDDIGEVLNPKILQWAEKIKISVDQAYIFINDPFNEIQHTHIDPKNPDELCFAINWCITGQDSEMVWYDIKPEYSFEDVVTERATYYTSIDTNKLNLIERYKLQGPTLVHTSVPHGIFRYSSEPRMSVSIRFAHSFKTWPEVVKYFSPYIIK
jgi:hypothetical protein